MLNYNFRDLLSAYEFECFSRDLINAHEGLDLASFAEGRDGGIDLRYSANKGETIIVQAKRYIDYQELKTALKKEVEKVKRLNPKRYIISTSADLTAKNKEEIISWFKPYIQHENDILAKQDLNKILSQHPNIEQQYYKLWLASTNVLVNIFNKNIANWTLFEEHEIQETIKTYVMNDSFDDAIKKLIQNHYVIISGEPGIGKTTLARVLIMHLLSDRFKNDSSPTHYQEFYCTNNNIEDLMRVFQAGKRQVFFYDDFLGQISLEEGERGFDKRIISFIKACRAAEDKLFILTTREYILQQGLVRYPVFTMGKGIEMSKCIVDMGKYTRFVRAQILYNHLVANNIPQSHINGVTRDKNYLKIIDHPHFSPRIIETFVENGTHERCEPSEYFSIVLGYFDHPDSVWLDAFKRLKDIAQEALLVLYTMPSPVLLEDWREAYYYFFKEVHKEVNYLKDQDWNDSVKMLQNNFIKTGKCPDGFYVEFHNPGVKEVLMRYVRDNESLMPFLLNHVYYIDQFFSIFSGYRHTEFRSDIQTKFESLIMDVFDRCWDKYKSCRLLVYRQSKDLEYYRRYPLSKVDALYYFAIDFKALLAKVPLYLEHKISQEIMTDDSCNLSSQLSLLEKIDCSKAGLDKEALFKYYCERLYSSVDCMSLADSIEKVFPNHADYLDSEEFCSMTADCLKQEFESTKESELEELDSTVRELCRHAPSLEYEPIVEEINKAYSDYNDYLEAQAEAYQDDYRYESRGEVGEDAWRIDNLFATLKD